MKLDVLSIGGSATGRSIDLPDVFELEPNQHAVWLAVKQYLAHQRQGTHKAKERNEITGSTRKLKKQKGTGTARMGSMKSPLLKGGGRAFGPKPRTYGIKVNKKVKRLARLSALVSKMQGDAVAVVENFAYDNPSTKQFRDMLKGMDLSNTKTLLVTGDYSPNLYLSCRNIAKANVMNVKDLNTYSIMNAQKILLSEDALTHIKENFL